MDLSQSQITMRQRNSWEAMDVGVRLWAERKWTYLLVWLCLSAPCCLLLTALFWESPWWAGLAIWWLKPWFEAPVLTLLSRRVFAPLPGFYACLRLAARAMWRPRLLADLTWRRFDLNREMTLPIVVLEQLSGKAYSLRRRELTRYGSGAAIWLTILGFHVEMILLYGGIIALYWLLYGSPVQDALMSPANMDMVGRQIWVWLGHLWQNGSYFMFRFANVFYVLVLCFWEPVYVAAGFGLYINARTQAEAWDIHLRFRQMAQRMGRPMSWVWLPLVCWCLAGAPDVRAEPLPDRAEAAEMQQQVLDKPPFPQVEKKYHYHWKNKRDNAHFDSHSLGSFVLSNSFVYGGVAVLVLVVASLLWRWLSRRMVTERAEPLPQQLFGLDLSEKAWPADVVAAACRLWPQQPRAAMALLYGGSLRAAHRHYALSLRDSDTEQEVLRRVCAQCPGTLHDFWLLLTRVWIQSAYAHRLPENAVFNDLCCQYRALFAVARS